MMKQKIKNIGEFGLIEKIKQKVKTFHKTTLLGIGDDTAVLRYTKQKYFLLTTDMLVEGVHFSLKTTSPKNFGKKAMLVNISDIVAMGGIPQFVLLSLGIPKLSSLDLIDKIYAGILEIAQEYSIDIIGGDTVKSPFIVLNISMFGIVKKENLKLRKGAQEGNLILMTGELGSSKIGLELLNGKKIPFISTISAKKYFIKKHLLPEVRLKEAEIIASNPYVTSLTDISDGLSISLKIMSQINKVKINLFTSLLPHSKFFKNPPLEYLLHGGEEYELLFTISPVGINQLLKEFSLKTSVPVSIIGEVKKGKGEIFLNGKKRLKILGYDHFKN